MSIWASMTLVGCENPEHVDGDCGECGGAARLRNYQGSHIMPDELSAGGDVIDASVLSRFVRYYREHPNGDDEPDGYEPWLRFGVYTEDGQSASTVMCRAQVIEMIAGLQTWVDETDD